MKKYVLTDPCYLINDDAAWRRYCGLIFDEKGYMNVDNGAAFIAEQLGTTVQVASTGYGDWANSLACVKGPNRLKNDGCFCADAGMVCFCANLTAQTATGPGLRSPTAPVFTCRKSATTRTRTITNG